MKHASWFLDEARGHLGAAIAQLVPTDDQITDIGSGVAGLVERDGHLIYNTAALIGPDGKLTGKYRKVTLPRGEIEAGIQHFVDNPALGIVNYTPFLDHSLELTPSLEVDYTSGQPGSSFTFR